MKVAYHFARAASSPPANATEAATHESAKSSKLTVAGGYLSLTAWQPLLAWHCYRKARRIRLIDLRCWFGCLEQRERRCPLRGRAPGEFPASYSHQELAKLCGTTVRKARESLRRLEGIGLITWSPESIELPTSPEQVKLADLAGFWTMMKMVPNAARRLPIPRRMLRLLAGGARPALIATVLAVVCRCIYTASSGVKPVGRVKSSWIADVFGLDVRRIKQARAELVALGWIQVLPSRQKALNQHGALVRVNLEWDRLDAVDAPAPCPKLAPPPAENAPGLAPPLCVDQEPLREPSKNQEPAAAARESGSGSCGSGVKGEGPLGPSSKPTQSAETNAPTMTNVTTEDLKDTARLLELHQDAVRRGLVTDSEHDTLRFVAAAEHARVIGTRNPCGLFARIVRGKLWPFITADDEDAANRRLKAHDRPAAGSFLAGSPLADVLRCDDDLGRGPQRFHSAAGPAVAETPDMRAVRTTIAGFQGTGHSPRRHLIVSQGWTPERYDAALAALEAARGRQQLTNAARAAGERS